MGINIGRILNGRGNVCQVKYYTHSWTFIYSSTDFKTVLSSHCNMNIFSQNGHDGN